MTTWAMRIAALYRAKGEATSGADLLSLIDYMKKGHLSRNGW